MFHIQHHIIQLIQQPRTVIQTKTFCFIESETNKCLIKHCAVVFSQALLELFRPAGLLGTPLKGLFQNS